MVLVAVAGGSSPTLGRSIVQAILATGKHEVIILSRAPSSTTNDDTPNNITTTPQTKHGATIKYVDYTSLDSLTTALHDVNTLISVLKSRQPGEGVKVHTLLLEACRSAGVARFVMSDWSLATMSHDKVDVLAEKGELLRMCEGENARTSAAAGEGVEGGSVACCTVQIGGFMNYFAQKTPKLDVKDEKETELSVELLAGLVDDLMLEYIDLSKNVLLIPCDADGKPVPVTLTHVLDVGELMALSLDLPADKMRGAIGMMGQAPTFEYVRQVLNERCGMDVLAQHVVRVDCEKRADEEGKKFNDAMARGEFDMQAFLNRLGAQLVAVQCDGPDGGAVIEPTLNRMLGEAGHQLKLRTVEDMLVKAWGKDKRWKWNWQWRWKQIPGVAKVTEKMDS